MSRYHRNLIIAGVCVVGLMILVPPFEAVHDDGVRVWQMFLRYDLLFLEPSRPEALVALFGQGPYPPLDEVRVRIDAQRMTTQVIGFGIVLAALWVIGGGKK